MENENSVPISLDSYQPPQKNKRKFKPEIEDAALNIVGQYLPTELRASERTQEIAYERGYILYNAGKFEEAISYFSVLMSADPGNVKYIFACAASHHMLQNYKKAIELYTFAGVVDPESPLPFYYASDCFIKMHDPFGALIILDVGLKRSHHVKYGKIIERMESMVKHLEQELGEKKSESSKSFINS